jgi:hypothetical protein
MEHILMKKLLWLLIVPLLVAAYDTSPQIRTADSPAVDAFGRLRVSSPLSLANYVHGWDGLPLLIDQVTNGTGAGAWDPNSGMMKMTTAASGDYVIRQTFARHAYAAGKSLIVAMTIQNFQPESNVVKRAGAFSSSTSGPYTANQDGFFLESSSGVVTMNLYRNGTQIASVAQSAWSADKLNGAGPSGATVSWTHAVIIGWDYQFLGEGRIRLMINQNGRWWLLHEIDNANAVDQPYMLHANQPLRWELRQTGAGSGAFNHICANVSQEGVQEQQGYEHSVDTTATGIALTGATTRHAVLAIRLKSSALDQSIVPRSIEILTSTSNDYGRWEMVINPTVAGTFTFADVTNVPIQSVVGTDANTVTGGMTITTGFYSAMMPVGELTKTLRRIGASIAGTADVLALVLTPLSGNQTVFGTINFEDMN